jgi:hypothetical protein
MSTSSTTIARAALAQHWPGKQLRYYAGQFYLWGQHAYLGGCFFEVKAKTLSPYIFQSLQAQGEAATTKAVREVTLALSAEVLAQVRPHPQFCDLLNACLSKGGA